jgi:riboflavin transporter 2
MLSSETKVKIASLLFGLGSWITITGFWQEVPILTDEVAEGWTLSSQLTLFIQAANIGPILYIIGHKYHLCNEVSATHTQMVVGVISCFILIFLWKTTVFVLGADRSVYLLVSAFGLSLLDCTSSVTFLPL